MLKPSRPSRIMFASVLMLSSCAWKHDSFELPTLDSAPDRAAADVIDVHAHFFNYCDLPEQALKDTFHVNDRGVFRAIGSAVGRHFLRKRGRDAERKDLCKVVTNSRGAERLRADEYHLIDFPRAAASDRLAIVASYFEHFPSVALVTPSMVDPDGWLNNANSLPPEPQWDARHHRYQDLAKHVNDETKMIRVLPIAGFNPMRGVTIDCTKGEFSAPEDCEAAWDWLNKSGPSGHKYLGAFEQLFQLRDGAPPFVGIKVYPSTGFSPSSHCDEVAKRWPDDDYSSFVAMAPIRNAWEWEGLPAPAETSGCHAAHEALMKKLRARARKVGRIRTFGKEKNMVDADDDELRVQIQLVGFLRLSAEIDRVMADMYDLAERLDLPILAHASPEGFALDDQFYQYGYPCEWEATVDAYPRVRFLLAHAGGSPHGEKKGKENKSFFPQVADFVKRKKNVYVDYSNRHGYDWPDAVADQAVYGSDFFMMTLGGKSGGYLQSHETLFSSPAEVDAYMRGNAIAFLMGPHVNIPYTGNRERICNYAKSVGLEFAPAIHARLCP